MVRQSRWPGSSDGSSNGLKIHVSPVRSRPGPPAKRTIPDAIALGIFAYEVGGHQTKSLVLVYILLCRFCFNCII